jgi:hypothetical protein
LPGHRNSFALVACKSPAAPADQLKLEPRDQLATLLKLAGRRTGPLEPAELGDVSAQVRRDPLVRSIEPRAW